MLPTETCVGSLDSDSVYSEYCFAWEHVLKNSPSLPSLFLLLIQCDRCLSPLPGGGSVARICQSWERSSSRSWLPTVEAPGCLRDTTSI